MLSGLKICSDLDLDLGLGLGTDGRREGGKGTISRSEHNNTVEPLNATTGLNSLPAHWGEWRDGKVNISTDFTTLPLYLYTSPPSSHHRYRDTHKDTIIGGIITLLC